MGSIGLTEAEALRSDTKFEAEGDRISWGQSAVPTQGLMNPRQSRFPGRRRQEKQSSSQGERRIYKVAKQRARAKRDIPKVTVVKSEVGRILAEKEKVLRRWREYFERLLNVDNTWEEPPAVEGPIQQVSLQEMSAVLKKTKDWGTSILVPVYKEKSNVLECGNHRGIKLLEYLLKVKEKILDQKIREVVDIGNMQLALDRGEARQILVPRELVYWCLPKKGVPEYLINIVKDTYESVTTMVRTPQGTSEEFEVKVGLHQGSSLSPLLFIIVIDVVSEECGGGLLWEMLFADDLVISATSEKNLEAQLRKWKKALEGHEKQQRSKKRDKHQIGERRKVRPS
ncbi:uncharacterized protein LOC125033263 [Penaeus chinensis]|uniref:uncharacterized protein LOC125033263 n=1 Tax=Penaeus chinensis TaxID=139456 RepID=UPI001FB5ACBA|nr:uncharacterized protein LOC125033263 [Penaeus chinensis]